VSDFRYVDGSYFRYVDGSGWRSVDARWMPASPASRNGWIGARKGQTTCLVTVICVVRKLR